MKECPVHHNSKKCFSLECFLWFVTLYREHKLIGSIGKCDLFRVIVMGFLMNLGQIEIYIFLPNGSWDGYSVWEQETDRICRSWASAEFTLHDCGGFCCWTTGAASQHTDLECCILLGRAAPLVIRRFFVFLPLPLSRAAAVERSMCVCKTLTW